MKHFVAEGPKPLRFDAIEVARAFAAILVVFYHASRIAAEPRFWGATAWGGRFANFNVGVDFFFVLSGFIICWVHHADLGRPDRLANYARKRFLRIYPPYWAVLVPLAALYVAFPGGGQPSDHDPANIALSFLLVPSPVEPVLGVAWTLKFEIFFYLLFAGAIVVGRSAFAVLALWAIAIVAATAYAPLPFPLSFVLSPFCLEFIAGIALALFLRPRPTMPASWLLPLGIGLFAAALFVPGIQDNALRGRAVFGGAALMILAGIVGITARRAATANNDGARAAAAQMPAFAIALGSASYAIYLVHPVGLSFLCQVLVRMGGRALPVEGAVMVLALAACGIGVLFHRLVERRVIRWAGALVGKSTKAPANIQTDAKGSPRE